jgi:hypothetical protein
METIPIPVSDALETAPKTAERDADDDLAKRAASDTAAFAELYVRHREPVFRYRAPAAATRTTRSRSWSSLASPPTAPLMFAFVHSASSCQAA